MKYSNPGELRYELELAPESRPPIELPSWDDLEPFVELDESIHVPSAVRYGESLRARLDDFRSLSAEAFLDKHA